MKRFLICTLTLFVIFTSIEGQEKKNTFSSLFKSKETKKELRKQRDSLLLLVDSLKFEVENLQIASDSPAIAMEEDTLNISTTEEIELSIIERDSLLNEWYEQKRLPLINDRFVELDTCELTSNIPDSLILERLRKMNSFISLPYNKSIRNQIIYYTQRIPSSVEKMIGLSYVYMPIFEEIFDQYDLPKELKAMAIIESFLNPVAVSRARARGMWQFMYTTALRYNLTINSYVDERYDPIKSAHAAAQYLSDSYKIFGDWPLAIASYNCGAGNVLKAIRRSGGGKDFWDIYDYLPRETRGYVPSFVAALYTITYYKEHGLNPVPATLPIHLDTLKINKMLHFEQISHFTGLRVEEIKVLNPQYLHDIIPGVEKEYILRLPLSVVPSFIDHEEEIYEYNDSLYFNSTTLKKIKETGSTSSDRIVHKVKKGETLGHIAIRYGVSVSSIKRWNNIGNTIRINQRLVIYTRGKGPTQSSSNSSSKVTTTNSKGYVIYTVKRGDNLWEIAKNFPGVSANNIMELNGMTSSSKILPGMKLKIKKSN